jgi:hypothetical protein
VQRYAPGSEAATLSEAERKVMSANGDGPIQQPAPPKARSMAEAIWQARVMGADVFEISAKLGITVEEVSELLMSHLRRIESQPIQQKGFYRAVSVTQLNKLIGTYLEVALLKEVVIERFRAGESVAETDCAYPLSCAAFCLAAIRLQSDLLGLKIQEQETSQALDPREMLAWMRNQIPLINEIVQSTPPDVPDLPVKCLDGADSLTESEIETAAAIAEFSPAIAKFDKLSAWTS